MLEFQVEIEKLFHKNQTIPRIKREFIECKEFDFLAHMTKHDIMPDFGFNLLAQMVLHKRADLPVMVGILKKYMMDDAQLTADEIMKACHADLVDWNPTIDKLIVRYLVSQDVLDEIDRYQFPLPLVVEPRELKKNSDNAYYTGKSSVILKNNHHEDDVCLDHINHLNKMKFQINRQVSDKVRNSWKSLDKPKADETLKEYRKRVRQFQKYERAAYDVMDHLGLSTGGQFYLAHKYDKRGRTYCQGYHVNYQGTPWNKAVIEFANQEVTT